jgi:endonuclease G
MASKDISHAERTRRLRDYLKLISLDEQLESAKTQLEAASAAHDAGSGEQLDVLTPTSADEAMESLDKLIRDPDAELSTSGLNSLEAIVHKVGRPVIDIRDDTLLNPPSKGEWKPLGTGETKKRLEDAIPSIGRIEVPNDSRPYAGTGFVVGKDLLMTNRHVARIFSSGIGQKNLKFDPEQTAAVDFKREVPRRNDPDPVLLSVTKILMIHPWWDMALLQVRGLPPERKPLRLSLTPPEQLIGRSVAVIGYPAKDDRNDIDLQLDIFDRVFEVKRLAPGRFHGRRDYKRNGVTYKTVAHDSSTLGGNSGSAVIDCDTGDVVALHFAGEYLVANWAVSMLDLAQDSRIVDSGVNFNPDQRVDPDGDFYGPIWAQADRGGPPIVLPEGTVTIEEEDESRELFFSRGPDASEFVSRFSLDSLGASRFDWKAALATALASHVAYLPENTVKETVLNAWRFEDCTFVEVDDTECFVATTGQVALIAFRGTELKIADWLADLNAMSTSCDYGRVHRGFLAGFRGVDSKLRHILNQSPRRPVILTGHSLGGALATIAAAEWFDTYTINSVYTFGQPAVGKGRFPSFMREHFAESFYRFVNYDDIVPMVPPTYRHVGRLFHFDSSGNLLDAAESISEALFTEMDETPTMTEVQFDQLRVQLLAARARQLEGGEEGLLPSFGDHKLIRYVQRIAAKAI